MQFDYFDKVSIYLKKQGMEQKRVKEFKDSYTGLLQRGSKWGKSRFCNIDLFDDLILSEIKPEQFGNSYYLLYNLVTIDDAPTPVDAFKRYIELIIDINSGSKDPKQSSLYQIMTNAKEHGKLSDKISNKWDKVRCASVLCNSIFASNQTGKNYINSSMNSDEIYNEQSKIFDKNNYSNSLHYWSYVSAMLNRVEPVFREQSEDELSKFLNSCCDLCKADNEYFIRWLLNTLCNVPDRPIEDIFQLISYAKKFNTIGNCEIFLNLILAVYKTADCDINLSKKVLDDIYEKHNNSFSHKNIQDILNTEEVIRSTRKLSKAHAHKYSYREKYRDLLVQFIN